jgi:hypothetical protein
MSIKSLKRHEGWLMVDQRAGNGLPEDVARMCGYDPSEVRAGMVYEVATLTCTHCKMAAVKNPLRIRAREYCKKCDHYICDFCARDAAAPGYTHTPFEKIVDVVQEAAHRGEVTSGLSSIFFPT